MSVLPVANVSGGALFHLFVKECVVRKYFSALFILGGLFCGICFADVPVGNRMVSFGVSSEAVCFALEDLGYKYEVLDVGEEDCCAFKVFPKGDLDKLFCLIALDEPMSDGDRFSLLSAGSLKLSGMNKHPVLLHVLADVWNEDMTLGSVQVFEEERGVMYRANLTCDQGVTYDAMRQFLEESIVTARSFIETAVEAPDRQRFLDSRMIDRIRITKPTAAELIQLGFEESDALLCGVTAEDIESLLIELSIEFEYEDLGGHPFFRLKLDDQGDGARVGLGLDQEMGGSASNCFSNVIACSLEQCPQVDGVKMRAVADQLNERFLLGAVSVNSEKQCMMYHGTFLCGNGVTRAALKQFIEMEVCTITDFLASARTLTVNGKENP